MKTYYDLVIIGAGPSGMAAAMEAKKHELSVVVLGEQYFPGGQIYRSIEQIGPELKNILGSDYLDGKTLVKKFRTASVDYFPGVAVWQVETDPDLVVSCIFDGHARQIRGSRIIVANGARERPVPIPGWTLPGVMAVTAVDVLLKSHSIIPNNNIILAGSGPLLFLSATRLIATGSTVKAIIDTTPLVNSVTSLPFLPKAFFAAEYLFKGLAMKREIRRKKIPIYRNVTKLAVSGNQAVEHIRFKSNGFLRELKADTILLHNGIVPDTQITSLLNCEMEWYDVQRYWKPVVDKWGNTSVSGICVAGDTSGIFGAKAAIASGHIVALEAAFILNFISRDERDSKSVFYKKQLARERLIRPFLDHLFRPDPNLLVPADDQTIVCRCEEVTVQQIREELSLGRLTPNQLKSQTRCGMGPCQGRMCGLTVSEIIADYEKVPITEVGYFRIRPPIKSITIEQLSKMLLVSQEKENCEI
jgi:thioredoxin reductase